jgi:hypothetical protein
VAFAESSLSAQAVPSVAGAESNSLSAKPWIPVVIPTSLREGFQIHSKSDSFVSLAKGQPNQQFPEYEANILYIISVVIDLVY